MDKRTLEKRIAEEILGIRYGGMYGGDAFYDFRNNFFDKIEAVETKAIVKEILMDMLKDKSRDADFIVRVAWICADLSIPGVAGEIQKLGSDKRIHGTIFGNGIRAALDQLELEKMLVNEIGRIENESDKRNSNDMYERVVASYRKKRGDTSQAYASKDLYDKAEDELSKVIVKNKMKILLKSENYDADFKAKLALILTELKILAKQQ